MVSEHEAQALLVAGTHDLVRDRAGRTRRLYERQPEDIPLRGRAKYQALASYTGSPKYTYVEALPVGKRLHMLKRLTRAGEFVRW